uniref:NACHT domain-containing protein n=1 Tax=Oreochromis aureus TaxID=47969 RepID=A0A668UD78_OREAU
CVCWQVIDPFESSDPSRWPDEDTRHQMIHECRGSSAGPFLLVNKYGTARLPAQVEVPELQLLLQQCQEAGVSTQELEKVYQRDENTIPTTYCLRAPHRRSYSLSKTKTKDEELRKLFQAAVSLCVQSGSMTPERAKSFYRSVHCEKFPLLYFQDATLSSSPSNEKLLSELCESFLPRLVTSRQLLVYTITTECDRRHGYTSARRRGYADSLCQQVYCDLVQMTDTFTDSNILFTVKMQALLFCVQLEILKHDMFFIIHFFMIYAPQRYHHFPLVVTGGPCTGKTVLLAHCTQQMKRWLADSDPVVISFFCNLSINASPKHLLSSLCQRQLDFGNIKPDACLSELKEHLSCLISHLPSTEKPLVLILDGLDQLKNNTGLQIIESLPRPVPPAVKLIVTASSNRAHFLQAIKLHYACHSVTEDMCTGRLCIQLGLVDRKQSVQMLASLLKGSGRRVTSGQQALVNQALAHCCLPLYARLLHAHTSLWHSDSDVTESSLPDGVHSSISALLDHLEQKHFSSVVARAISYLTLSRSGLTEAELADLLSIKEDWPHIGSPFKMTVPQVDVERLLLDLKSFLIQRKVAGSLVLFWVSRHFKLVVAKRYLDAPDVRRRLHSQMVDYFSGQTSGVNKDAALKTHTDTRQPSQPFVFTSIKRGGRVNVRKIVELPYHLQQSGRWKEFERMLLLSFGFHQAMLRAGLLGDLLAMLEAEEESSQVKFVRERLLLASTLKSSACFLQSSPLQLPAVMETNLLPYLEVFPALEGYVREIKEGRGRGLGIALCPSPPCVPHIQYLKYDDINKDVCVREIAGTKCGVVAEITDDGSAWIWKGCGYDVAKLSLRCEETELKFAGVKSSGPFLLLSTNCSKLFVWDVEGPEKFLEVKDPFKNTCESSETPSNIEGFVAHQKTLSVWWKDESFVSVFDISSETLTHFQCQSPVTCSVFSSDGFFMYCGQEEGTVSVFDMKSSSLLSTCSNSNHSAVTLIILHEDKREMACVDRTGSVALWDVAANTQPPRLVKESFTQGYSTNILSTDYSSEINTLLMCQAHQASLWDTCNWELWDQFLAPQGRAFTQAVLSQDGHLFLALLDTCTFVLVWRVSSGECVLSLETNKQPHTLLKMASDVICVSHDGCLTVWDSEMIDAAGSAQKMGGGVKEVVVEQTGVWFYTRDGSEKVWKWSLDTGLPHVNFLHTGPVEKLQLSPNGIHLVSLSAGDIYVWRTETGENILRIGGSRARDILITPNNNFGVSISERGLSRVFKIAQGNIVCSIHPYLSDAQVSPESTYLLGCCHGDLLAASLWSGSISKRFSCVESSEEVVAFQTLSQHPEFVVVMAASGTVYTWKVAEETVCWHFQLPHMFHCQPEDFQMSSNGSYALLSIDSGAINLLNLSRVTLCSFKVEGPVIKAYLDKTGRYVAYITTPSGLEDGCDCYLHARPILQVMRLSDGERLGAVHLSKNPLALVICEQHCVFVGFGDGSVGVYYISDVTVDEDEPIRCWEDPSGQLKQCPFDRTTSNHSLWIWTSHCN